MTDSALSAKRYAFLLLRYRNRSEKELHDRLGRKGFSEPHISRALTDLRKAGLLDDRALARDLKLQAFETRLLGYSRAKNFLLARGVPDEIVHETLDYDEVAEIQNAQRALDKKLRKLGDCPDNIKKKRLWDFLVRRGYSFSAVRRAMENLKVVEEEE